MKKIRSIIAIVIALVLCVAVLTGCVRATQLAPALQEKSKITNSDKTATGNNADTSKTNNADASVKETGKNGNKSARIGDDWEVIISYDVDGIVTEVTAYNDDTFQSKSYSGYEGKDHNTVVDELVEAIKNEGYYVDDIDREISHITIDVSDRYDHDDKYDWD